MSIDLNLIKQIFPNSEPIAHHRILIRNGNELLAVDKKNPQSKGKRIRLDAILYSLFETVKTAPLDASDLVCSLKISKYFIQRIKPSKNKIAQLISNIYKKISNYFNGYGFKTTLQIATDIEQILVSKKAQLPFSPNFVVEEFDTAMSKFHERPMDPRFKSDPDFRVIRKNFASFCEKVTASPSAAAAPPQDATIPPTIHFIWLGSAVPAKVNAIIDTWRPHHPGWAIKIWTNADIETFPWKNRAAFDEAIKDKSWAEAADVWRYDILAEEGGIYSDTDVVCVKSFNDLISNGVQFFAGQETNQVYTGIGYEKPLYMCNAVIGASKGNPIIKECQAKLKPRSQSAYPDNPRKDILLRTGPALLSRACSQELHGSNPDGILVLPCSYIYPLPWFADQRHKAMSREQIQQDYVGPESQCIHLWDASW